MANTRPEFLIEDGRMRVAENEANANRKHISVFNAVEGQKSHLRVFIIYLRALATAQGTAVIIQQPPREGAVPQRDKTQKECKVNIIVEAKDLASKEYEECSQRKNVGNTTIEENSQRGRALLAER